MNTKGKDLRDLEALDAVTLVRYSASNYRSQVGKTGEFVRDEAAFLRMCLDIERQAVENFIASRPTPSQVPGPTGEREK
jgi:hypothetical protein